MRIRKKGNEINPFQASDYIYEYIFLWSPKRIGKNRAAIAGHLLIFGYLQDEGLFFSKNNDYIYPLINETLLLIYV